jgi:hypothetical protein
LPRKIHDRLRAGGYEVMADDQAGRRASLDADILAALTPDLLKRQLVGSGGVVYNNVVIRQLEAADPSLPVPSPAEPPGQAKAADAPLPGSSSAEPVPAPESEERPPGRPSVMKQIREEMRRRARAQPCELCASMRAEAGVLAEWAKVRFKENAPTVESIRTSEPMVKLCKELKAGSSGVK